jgi:hypothetical protein
MPASLFMFQILELKSFKTDHPFQEIFNNPQTYSAT